MIYSLPAPLHPTHPVHTAYLVVANTDSGVSLPSAFLDKMESEFKSKCAGAVVQLGAAAGSLNATFG